MQGTLTNILYLLYRSVKWQQKLIRGSKFVISLNACEFSFPKYHIWKSLLWPQKSNRLTTTLHVHHAFLFVSLLSLHDYDMKMFNFTFCRGQKHKTMTVFLFLNFDTVL